MNKSWKDSIYQQREGLARILREPLEKVAKQCFSSVEDKQSLNQILLTSFGTIPHCSYLYVLKTNGLQISEHIGKRGLIPGQYAQDRSLRPYMLEVVPSWGFLLSDAYFSLYEQRPTLTALQIIRGDQQVLGYLAADFDLHDLPVTSELYEEPSHWQQVKGDPAIRGTLFQQSRTESIMDKNLSLSLSILKELFVDRGLFQCQIHFSSSRATIWMIDDPFRYRLLDSEALLDQDICLIYPLTHYPDKALIPKTELSKIFDTLSALRMADETIYLRTASINIFNGMISLTFSCDGSHFMRYDEFLAKNISFWFGTS